MTNATMVSSSPAREPIAITGIGCRLPGKADTPAKYWQLLIEGVDAISEVPSERWDLNCYFNSDPNRTGTMYSRWGGFLPQIDRFDTLFFGISPREAAAMDPQQRILLEIAWEALEHAGYPADALAGTNAGVFIGISSHDYSDILFADPDQSGIDHYTMTGGALSIAANRISYFFDFRGPSIAVDTACSSSLVATHLACQSIWNNQASIALAGGVNIVLSPMPTIGFSRASMLSPDGRCKAFDSRANGYVRSEGAGIVVLKPLSRALADGDRIIATILGTGANQDGHTRGMTVPSRDAQSALLRSVYREAGIAPSDVQYIEAHGTGTPVGDPIEAAALGDVLSEGRPEGQFCSVGSVKTNIGHLESASGIAALIKTALALKHRKIPGNLHFLKANPKIPFDAQKLRFRTRRARGPRPPERHAPASTRSALVEPTPTSCSASSLATTPTPKSGAKRREATTRPARPTRPRRTSCRYRRAVPRRSTQPSPRSALTPTNIRTLTCKLSAIPRPFVAITISSGMRWSSSRTKSWSSSCTCCRRGSCGPMPNSGNRHAGPSSPSCFPAWAPNGGAWAGSC